MISIEERLAEYQRDGYTVFKQYLSPDKLAEIRAVFDPIMHQHFIENPSRYRISLPNLMADDEHAALFEDHLLNPEYLDFAERVIGPYVQLDSFEITGYSTQPISDKNRVAHWHRDAFNLTENWDGYKFSYERKSRHYTAPLACNCLTYLQDMNEDTGSLRVIPGSHLDYTMIDKEDMEKPHPKEKLVTLEAGDMVFTHCELLHAGSLNTSSAIRYFISIYIERIGLPHRDSLETPAIERIVKVAEQNNDYRTLRFFGRDTDFNQRQQVSWQKMIAEDQAARLNIAK
ncbi:MAG: phytanoyl-CoA dioxygenase family protein [Chloroflexota bacterium]